MQTSSICSQKHITKYEYASSNGPIEVSHIDTVHAPCSIQKVISHEDSSLFLTADGNVYALGRNKDYQFGISGDCKILTRLSVTDVIDIGFRHRSLILQRGNILQGCGSNTNYALGINTSQSPIRELTELPKHIYRNENILFVASGHSFSVIVTAENNLYMMGQNWLDPNDNESKDTVQHSISEVTKNGYVVSLHSSSFHIALLNSVGEVFLGGDTDCGKIGLPNKGNVVGLKKLRTEHVFTLVSLFSDSTALVTRDGTVVLYGQAAGQRSPDEQNVLVVTEKFPPVIAISGIRNLITICTDDGNVHLYDCISRTSKVIGCTDTNYNVVCSSITATSFVCLSTERNVIAGKFPLIKKCMHRNELCDVTINF